MPLLPFVWLLGAVAVAAWLGHPIVRLGLPVLLIWYGLGTLMQHPHYLSYFNAAVGGSEQGYHYLGDSNIDWGQDLNLLAEYAREQSPPVYYSYFGASDPLYYGLPGPENLPTGFAPANPAPGHYAISVNHLQGMLTERWDRFDWFRRQEPAGSLGYSILLYEVPEATSGSWIAHCLDPGPLLAPEEAAQLVGVGEARHLYFDCRDGWVFPEDGAPGWYLLPQQAQPWPMAEAFPDRLSHVYKHSANEWAPSYDIYYWAGGPVSKLATSSRRPVTPDGRPVTLPASAGGVVHLSGYGRGSGGVWHTLWQVEAGTEEPLSISAHFNDDDGLVEVVDGLAFVTTHWQPGDIFVQYHNPVEQLDPSYLAIGLYNYRTGKTLAFDLAGEPEALHLRSPE